MKRRDVAMILLLIVDVAYIVWGAMAAASPDHLLKGPVARRSSPPLTKATPMAPGRSW